MYVYVFNKILLSKNMFTPVSLSVSPEAAAEEFAAGDAAALASCVGGGGCGSGEVGSRITGLVTGGPKGT